MRALIIGATGAVGRDLVQLLIHDDSFEEINIFVRRDPNIKNEKVKVHVVDFDHPDNWRLLVQGDVVFSCMGTSRRAVGSKDAQYTVDYTYQYQFAKTAVEQGVKAYILVSSAMANPDSLFFYTQMKGKLERAINQLPFQQISILRPPSLIRKGSTRLNEKIAVAVLQFFNRFGLLMSQRPMKTEILAKSMVSLAKSGKSGVFETQEIFSLDE